MSKIKNAFHDEIIEMEKQTDDYGQFEVYCKEYMKTEEYRTDHQQAFYDNDKEEVKREM